MTQFNLLIVLTKPMDGRSRMYRSSEIIGKMTENQNYQAAAVCISTFQNCCGLHSALAEARRQCDDPASQYNWPGPDYVKAFLLAVNGDVQTGMKVLDEFWTRRDGDFPPALYEKLQKKLLACADGGDNINDRK